MSLIGLLILLIVVGLVLYLVETLLPIDPAIKNVIRVVVVLVLILYLLNLFVGWGPVVLAPSGRGPVR
jgi:hypothetical protein